jgi:hypothetical protein
MGIRRSHGWRTRTVKHANTSKRRCHVKLRASHERIAASYSAQSRVSHQMKWGRRKTKPRES